VAILIDDPRWPAHGRLWAHLVSDSDLDELHAFAEANGIPRRGFDRDHYDVPAEWYDRVVAAGAVPVSSRELIVRLRAAGLRRRKPETSIEELLPGYLEDGHFERPASPWRTEGLDPAERDELRELVMRSIHSLPEGHRNVLLLRDIENLDTEEAAELLGISPGAVKTRLHRARQALRELLEPHLREGTP